MKFLKNLFYRWLFFGLPAHNRIKCMTAFNSWNFSNEKCVLGLAGVKFNRDSRFVQATNSSEWNRLIFILHVIYLTKESANKHCLALSVQWPPWARPPPPSIWHFRSPSTRKPLLLAIGVLFSCQIPPLGPPRSLLSFLNLCLPILSL